MTKERIVILGHIKSEKNDTYGIINIDRDVMVYVDTKRFDNGYNNIARAYNIIADNREITMYDFNNHGKNRDRYGSLFSTTFTARNIFYLDESKARCLEITEEVDCHGYKMYNYERRRNIVISESNEHNKLYRDMTKYFADIQRQSAIDGMRVSMVADSIEMTIDRKFRKVVVPDYVTFLNLNSTVENLIIPDTLKRISNMTQCKKPIRRIIAKKGHNILKADLINSCEELTYEIKADLSTVRKVACDLSGLSENSLYLPQADRVALTYTEYLSAKEIILGKNIKRIDGLGDDNDSVKSISILGDEYFIENDALCMLHGLNEINIVKGITRSTLGRIEEARDKCGEHVRINYIK